MNITTIPLTNINPAEYNPRSITKDEFAGLKESLSTFGQQENLIVNKDMTLISGHQRLQAMLSLGWTEAICNVVDLDKHEEKKLNVLMNSQAISGQWDDLKLSEILEELKLDDNYESLRLNALEPLDLSPTEVEEDEPPEVSSDPPVSQLGEIYQLGRHRVMCGDSTDKASVELLMNGVKADMVFTDPPYGMDLDTDYSKLKSGEGKSIKHSKVIGDDKPYDPKPLFDMFGYCKEIMLFGADYYLPRIPEWDKGNWIIWDKRETENYDKVIGSSFEVLWTKVKRRKEILRYEFVSWGKRMEDGEKTHPTMKPVKLLSRILNMTDCKIIIDVFLGSGSTLIACEQTDRTCYGMELDPKYVDVIRKRYWKFVNGSEEGWIDGTTNRNDA